MKKIAALFAIFLALGLFVYFYEIKGREAREEAEKLEESLLRVKQDEITGVEIIHPEKETVVLEREGEQWVIKQPIEFVAGRSEVDSLLRNLQEARRERTFPEGAAEAEEYGLDEPRLTLKIRTAQGEKILLVGNEDFRGLNVYAQLQGEPQVFITSDSIYNTADKEVTEWRSKEVLSLESDRVQAIEITRSSGEVKLAKKDGNWFLEAPLQDTADQGAVRSLLSSLESAEAQEFVSETAQNLKAHGLEPPQTVVRLRQEGEDRWRTLHLGNKRDETYLARNPERSPVFTVREDLHEKLTQDVWALRNKEVLDIDQDQITELSIRRGEQELVLKRDQYRWIIQQPETHKDKEAMAHVFWYPMDDMKFETIQDGPQRSGNSFPEPQVQVGVSLQDGTTRTYDFAHQGDQYVARSDVGRQGTISKESFEKLQFEVDDMVQN